MTSIGSPSPFFLAGKKAYEVERSLRFNNGDSPYLRRDPTSTSNRKTSTLSVWLKRTKLSTSNSVVIFGSNKTGSSTAQVQLGFESNNTFTLRARQNGTTNGAGTSTAVFRDPSAWYHIVYVLDTTQATNTNRFKLYVNGEQQTISYSSYPAQNGDLNMNLSGCAMQFGAVYYGGSNVSNRGAFYLAEVNWIDGQAYDPSYFAETNALTGQWVPKQYTGSYGTNGFYLNFSDNSGTTATTLGKDSSGNGNNFTPNNFSVATGAGNDSVIDTPTNNFCTFNPLKKNISTPVTYTEGNLQYNGVSGNNYCRSSATISVSSGKWYVEFKMVSGYSATDPTLRIGIITSSAGHRDSNNDGLYYENTNNAVSVNYGAGGAIYVSNTSQITGLTTYTNNDVLGIALDLDNDKFFVSKNGTFFSNGTGTQDPAAGTNPLYSGGVITSRKSEGFEISFQGYSDKVVTADFGQQGFAYTPPAGFKAICTANFPDPTILLPNKHFDTKLWTGNGGTQTIDELNFSPDWVWIKSRSSAINHQLIDTVRGATLRLQSNTTTEEKTNTNGLSAFTSDGYTLGDQNNVNGSGLSLVGWNWNAGDTDGKTYTVTVVSDSGNKYRFDGFGTSAVTLDLAEGGTYIFNYPSAHPLKFSTTSDGTHGGGSEYTTGVTHNSSTQVTIVVAASAPQLYYYCSIHSGMGGAINTNTTLGSSNFDGSIQSTVKVNATAGFSIIKYAGSGQPRTIGHGLGVAPDVVITKSRDSADNWLVWHQNISTSNLGNYAIFLNSDGGPDDASQNWYDTVPTSTVFTRGNYSSGDDMIAYCFSGVEGYSKFGSYTGNGSTDGTFVFLGFRPALIIVKRTDDSSSDWYIFDNKRPAFNVIDNYISPNLTNAEISFTSLDILSNGFKLRNTGNDLNGSSGTIIYLAFAESPFKNARAR